MGNDATGMVNVSRHLHNPSAGHFCYDIGVSASDNPSDRSLQSENEDCTRY